MTANLEPIINQAWDNRADVSVDTRGEIRDAVEEALKQLDSGEARVAQKGADGNWVVNQWLKKAVLLSFRLNANGPIKGGPDGSTWWDKVPSKFDGWSADDFAASGLRAVPNAVARRGSYIASGVVLMPSFVNIGAYVDEGTMVDTWATVGSCIGGVLEPLQANPTIIEDNCFIGARAEVAEGVIVREGSVLAMGTFLSQSTKIVYRETGEVVMGEVPAYSVIVPGSMPDPKGGPSLYCAVIIKTVDERTRSKTGINELLRP